MTNQAANPEENGKTVSFNKLLFEMYTCILRYRSQESTLY